MPRTSPLSIVDFEAKTQDTYAYDISSVLSLPVMLAITDLKKRFILIPKVHYLVGHGQEDVTIAPHWVPFSKEALLNLR
jgi:hypothetical protein